MGRCSREPGVKDDIPCSVQLGECCAIYWNMEQKRTARLEGRRWRQLEHVSSSVLWTSKRRCPSGKWIYGSGAQEKGLSWSLGSLWLKGTLPCFWLKWLSLRYLAPKPVLKISRDSTFTVLHGASSARAGLGALQTWAVRQSCWSRRVPPVQIPAS